MYRGRVGETVCGTDRNPMSAWYVYILKCADGSLYAGITTNLSRRLEEHNRDNGMGARYTRVRRPVKLVYHESCASRSEAARREIAIKRLRRSKKQALILDCSTVPGSRR